MTQGEINSDAVAQAAAVLGIGERASLDEIKARYRTLLKEWHPDTISHNQDDFTKMTAKITAAYEVVMKYCESYRYAFSKKDILEHLPDAARMREKWNRQYGNDPVWGNR